MTFKELGIIQPILTALHDEGYTNPTPIQQQAILPVAQGKDLLGCAQTGTGKTAAFAIPILQLLSNTPAKARNIRALILTPTRELALQIDESLATYGKNLRIRHTAIFGGVPQGKQTKILQAGIDILVATPGRLLDLMQQGYISLSGIEIFVLDEADRMLDMGFLPDIQRIINLLAPQRQSLMFSATFSPEIRKLARSFLKEPQLIEVARRNALADNVEQTVYRVDGDEAKRVAVASLIRDRGLEQVIVFSNTKIGAGRLARQLQKEGLKAEAIHGDRSQQERLQTLEAFKQGEIKVLVATDVAARGLDIVELPAVINFDLPHSPEDYIHRIGRTGRAGASGMALSLMVDKDQRALADIEKLTQRKLNVESLTVALPGRRDGGREAAPDAFRGGREKRGRESGASRRDAAPDRERTAPARRNGSPPSRAPKSDPFFSRPYEPGPEAGEETAAEPVTRNGLRRPARKVAALLGGKPGNA